MPKRIQKVLKKEEIKLLIKNIKNSKHKIMIALMYSAGLRVSELINLKVEDLELKNRYGFVRNGKEGKDRLFIISERLAPVLKQIILDNNLGKEDYLFLSRRNKKYSVRTIQKIVKDASKKAGLDFKEIHPHTLRHSFATHLIEQGDCVGDVQAMLGHKSQETSLNYIHSSGKMLNIKSPFDRL